MNPWATSTCLTELLYQGLFNQQNFMSVSQFTGQFLSPEAVLRGLLESMDNPCNCGQAQSSCECEEAELNEQIVALQHETNNIRSEIAEADRLLQFRDQMYSQLDQLREERNQIEGEIEGQTDYERTETFKSSGYKEMNERLRRRIYEVREYIQKMTFENQKIEEGMIANQYREQEEEYVARRNMYYSPPAYEGKRQYTSNLQSMVGRIQDKQEEAWRRVRRQQQQIDRRNTQTRMRKTNPGGFTYYSPKARTYYSPPRQIY